MFAWLLLKELMNSSNTVSCGINKKIAKILQADSTSF